MSAKENEHKIIWVADEYRPHDHDKAWYAGLFLCGAILITWALYTNNLITAILFSLMVVILYGLSHHRPSKILVELTEKGISLNNVFYSYGNLVNFCIIQHPGHEPVLVVETKSLLNRHLSVELEEEDPEEVHKFLSHFLEEVEDYQENFIDFIGRKLRI